MKYKNTLSFARERDEQDPLSSFRSRFHIPEQNSKEVIYFCGNSLGLQPKETKKSIEQELQDWARLAVEGHFEGKNPWVSYHKIFRPFLSHLLGAKPVEVVAMNSLTTNLHLLMVSFYQPTLQRFKILTEGKSFPSDRYALQSQIRFHGFSCEDGLVEMFPREGETFLRTEDILQTMEALGDELALVMMGGVNYYTGQAFEMEKITATAHRVGALAGFDLAHAIGNLNLSLHDWGVDFALWCSYKYLNSGPGSVGGAYVHEKYKNDPSLHRFAGWWGSGETARFQMKSEFQIAEGADGWQLSNAPVLSMAAHKAALEIFEEAGMKALGEKRDLLTGYLEFLLRELIQKGSIPLQILTPQNPRQRGCQLSLCFSKRGKELYQWLKKKGMIVDWREPDVIRVAPVPLYNTFSEVWHFAQGIQEFYDA